MVHLSTVLLVAAKTVMLICGIALTTVTYRAYARNGAPAMRALSYGIGLVTAGGVLAGSLHQLVGVPVATSSVVESVFMAAGFAVMTYSLYAEQPAGPASPETGR